MRALRIFGLMVLLLAGFAAFRNPAGATERLTGETIILPASRVVDDDILAAGREVQIESRVNGDVTAAGRGVVISGLVKQDIWAAGQDVVVNAPVGDDLRAMGQTVTVNAPVAKNADLAGATIVLDAKGSVGKDANIAGGDVNVQGRIGRNLALAAGNATLASEVGGTVEASVGQMTLAPGALVHGDLIVNGQNPPTISPEAKVLGRVDFRKAAAAPRQTGPDFGGWLVWVAFKFLVLLILGAIGLALSHIWMDRVADMLLRQTGPALLTGFLLLILVPLACLVLAITLIGIPLSLILLAIYSVALLLSGVFVSYEVGGWLLKRLGRALKSPYAQLAWGAVVIAIATSLP
ncbi:MAG TPA: hypothetical protein VFB21_22745 [Chthonomonadaceae bacterium]|nr:hypothetical protein [Chthonomonadaceae bacterium]